MANRYPAVSEKHINKAIASALGRIRNQAIDETPVGATGQLKGKWLIRVGRFEGSLKNIMQSKDGRYYGYDVEMGREPFFISARDIGPWAIKKGLNPYAVAKSIRRKGTRANPFFQRAILSQKDAIEKEFDKALDGIIKDI